jgi:hypothetical protein
VGGWDDGDGDDGYFGVRLDMPGSWIFGGVVNLTTHRSKHAVVAAFKRQPLHAMLHRFGAELSE